MINYAGNNSSGNVQNFINQDINNNNNNNNNINNNSNINNQDLNNIQNNNNSKAVKKSGPNYFDNPTDRIKSRYEMELKKSYTTNYYNANKNKNEKINQKSINISNKLYSQGINFIKKKEKINEEKQKADLEEYKKHSFKPNLNNSNSTNFANPNNMSTNIINYNSSNSSVNFASNNLSGMNRNNNNNVVESNVPNRNASIGKSNFKTNISKNSQLTQNSNNSSSTHFTKIQPKGAYSRNKNSGENVNNFNNNNNINYNFSTNVNNNIYNLSSMNSNNTINSNNLILNNVYNHPNNNNQILNNLTYSGEEYKATNQLSAMNISTNNMNNSAIYTQLENRSSSAQYPKNNKFEREDSSDLTKSINSNFYEKCIKWKDNKEQRANKLREEKSKEELKKCSFSPKIIPKVKNFFEEKFTKNDNNMLRNDYVTRMMNAHNKKEQEKSFQSKIFCENSKNSKMKITQPQEFNFSQLVSRKCRENFNKAKVLHRAESVKNYRENLSTNIFFNQAVFEIEENINNNPNKESVNVSLNNNNTVGAYEKLVPKKPESSQLVNKNMNINFNVNIMMNK